MPVVNAPGKGFESTSEKSLKGASTEDSLLPTEQTFMTDESFGHAYQDGFPLTVKFLLSRGVSYEAALDTAQSAWARGWEKRNQLRQPNLVLTWTNSIALNLYRTFLRRERQTEPIEDIQQSTSLNVAAIDVKRILTQCKPNDRIVLEEHYIDGYKAGEIAEQRGCSETAIRIRLLRARRKVRRLVVVAKPNSIVAS
jgi:RNA polymerase sigma-70 factor, ECF subfamily